MIIHGCKDYTINNLVKFGSGDAMHHNHTMHK
jgi:hypothetical protein